MRARRYSGRGETRCALISIAAPELAWVPCTHCPCAPRTITFGDCAGEDETRHGVDGPHDQRLPVVQPSEDFDMARPGALGPRYRELIEDDDVLHASGGPSALELTESIRLGCIPTGSGSGDLDGAGPR